MKYKITEDDCVNLWGWLRPEEIEREFGSRSKSSRQIRRYFEKYRLPSVVAFQDKFVEEATKLCPESQNQTEWAGEVHEYLGMKAVREKERMWGKITQFENLWQLK